MLKRTAILDDYQGALAAQPYWQGLADRIVIDVYRDTLHDADKLAERLRSYSIVVAIRERTLFPSRVLERLPNLELLSLGGRSSGQVDIAAATSRGILVTQTGGSTASAVELTMALMLALARRIPDEDRAMRKGLWQTGVGYDLSGKTLGLVGLGRIGTRIAAFGKLLGMRVLAWSANLTPEKAAAAGANYVSLDELCRESDVVSLHLRLSERTQGIFSARHIAMLKSTAFLVNTARGGLIDEPALVTALREKRIRGAALDVFQTEPLPSDHPLRSLENVVLTPHMGFVTAETYDQYARESAANIEAYLNGNVPEGAVNPEALARRAPASR